MLQVQHVLVENALRERVTLRVDGGIKTGWEAWWQWLGGMVYAPKLPEQSWILGHGAVEIIG